MAQINIYVPDPLARTVRAEAQRRRQSLSQYLVALIQRHAGGEKGWREDFFTSVVGGWKGELEAVPRPPAEDRPGL
jgi:hypothetical protein